MNKAFIFDLDGTLINSMVYWLNLAKNYLKSKGITDIEPDLNDKLKSMSTRRCAEYLVNNYPIGDVETAIEELTAIIIDDYKNNIEAKPGLKEFLLKYKDYKMCVATANTEILTTLALKQNGIYEYFDFILTCEEIDTSKDSPEIYIKCAEKMNEKITNCIVFEDVLHAVYTAKSAGFYTVAISDEYSKSEENEIKNIADKFIYNYNEINF